MQVLYFLMRSQTIFELTLSIICFLIKLERKKHFMLRLFISYSIILIVSNLELWILVLLKANTVISTIILTLSFFALIMAMILNCFKCDFWLTLFISTAGLTINQGFIRIMSVINSFFITSESSVWLPYLLYWAALAIYMSLVYAFVIHKLNIAQIIIDNRHTLIISMLFIFMVIFSFIGAVYLNFGQGTDRILFAYAAFLSLFVCPLILINLMDSLRKKQMEREIDIIKASWAADRKQYEFAKQNVEIINMKYHDLKYKTAQSPYPDDELPKFALIKTGNEAMDVLLTEKYYSCERHGIAFINVVDGKALSFIQLSDIYSLFGNAIDNAIECLEKLDDPVKKTITFTVKQIYGMVHIQIENYVPSIPEIKNGLPVTTKNDKENHGFGLKSMRMIAEKYHGDMCVDIKDNIFTLLFLLPKVPQE